MMFYCDVVRLLMNLYKINTWNIFINDSSNKMIKIYALSDILIMFSDFWDLIHFKEKEREKHVFET